MAPPGSLREYEVAAKAMHFSVFDGFERNLFKGIGTVAQYTDRHATSMIMGTSDIVAAPLRKLSMASSARSMASSKGKHRELLD